MKEIVDNAKNHQQKMIIATGGEHDLDMYIP